MATDKLPRPGIISDAQRLDWLERHGDVSATTSLQPSDGVFSRFAWFKTDVGSSLRDAIDEQMRSR